MKKFKSIIREFYLTDDPWDLMPLLLSGKSIYAVSYSNGDKEYVDEEYYKDMGKELVSKKRGKTVERVHRITAEEIMS